MKLEFKPEDFSFLDEHAMTYRKAIANQAQASFDAWLSEQVRVYQLEPANNYGWYPDENSKEKYKRTALLVCIEEIVKKPCEHEPDYPISHSGGLSHKEFQAECNCKHCGVKLKAKWEEV